jgi:hypothetical protein
MAGNEYRFITHWRVRGTCECVAQVLEDVAQLPRWWPSLYLDVRILQPAHGDHGLGEVVECLSKARLPYTMRFRFTVTEQHYPHGSTIESHGDLVGRGIWTFRQDGPFVDITHEWYVRAEKPLLKVLTPLLRPVFEWNHRWAMEQGERSLKAELERLGFSQTPQLGDNLVAGIAAAHK